MQGGSQSHPSGFTLEVGRGQRHPADAVPDHVRSKLDYGCIVYGTASNTNLRQLDSIHNAGLRLALGAFCTSPVSSMYTEANEAPLEERRLKLSMNYNLKTRACTDNPAHHALHEFDPTTRDLYLPFCTSPVSSMYTEANEAPLEERRLKLSMNYNLKTRACTDNPAHHALHEFDPTTRDLYLPRPNGKGGMTRPPAKPIGLKVEEAMASAEIDLETVCPLKTPTFPPGTHEYDPKRHSLIEGVSKCMITRGSGQIHKRLRPNSESIAMLKDHMMKSTLTDLRSTREWGQQRHQPPFQARMVRRLAASCPKDSQITVPSLLLRQQQSHWH